MSAANRLRRDAAAADLATVAGLVTRLDPADQFGRLSLEGRKMVLEQEVTALEKTLPDTSASAALYFGGGPVVGSSGIESGFGGAAISKFQDLVAKLAIEDRGTLGERGPLPAHEEAKLHITGVLHGSFGFMLEELQPIGDIFETPLKAAVDRATRILEAFSDSNEETFEQALESTDPRTVSAARDFFDLLSANHATLRLVTGADQLVVTIGGVERAAERALSSRVDEDVDTFDGVLAGLLPAGHMFDLVLTDPQANSEAAVITGRVSRTLSSADLSALLLAHLNQPVIATLKMRSVYRRGAFARRSYTLLGLEPAGALLEGHDDGSSE